MLFQFWYNRTYYFCYNSWSKQDDGFCMHVYYVGWYKKKKWKRGWILVLVLHTKLVLLINSYRISWILIIHNSVLQFFFEDFSFLLCNPIYSKYLYVRGSTEKNNYVCFTNYTWNYEKNLNIVLRPTISFRCYELNNMLLFWEDYNVMWRSSWYFFLERWVQWNVSRWVDNFDRRLPVYYVPL